MPVNPEHQFAEWTTPRDWADLASGHRLDPDRVVDTARRISGLVLERMHDAVEGMDERIAGRLQSCWAKANEGIASTRPGGGTPHEGAGMETGPMDLPADPTATSTTTMSEPGPSL